MLENDSVHLNQYPEARLLQYAKDIEDIIQMPVIAYLPTNHVKLLGHEDLRILSAVMKSLQHTESLALIISSPGGEIDAAKELLALLRRYTKRLHVFVVKRAVSAAAILCLGADKIYLTSTATLSPVDPVLQKVDFQSDNSLPDLMSSEDIRSFFEMSKEWFQLDEDVIKGETLKLLCSHIFPTTISKLYRAEKYLTQYLIELLKVQMQSRTDSEIELTVRQLISGYPTHGFALGMHELTNLGLNVHYTEPLLTDLLLAVEDYCCDLGEGSFADSASSNVIKGCYLFTTNTVAEFGADRLKDTGDGVSELFTGYTEAKWKVILNSVLE